jgi:hypothetical protein
LRDLKLLADDMLGKKVDFIDSLSIDVVSGPWWQVDFARPPGASRR